MSESMLLLRLHEANTSQRAMLADFNILARDSYGMEG